jgi:hypothetical protein
MKRSVRSSVKAAQAIKPQVCLLLFVNFFFQIKKKLNIPYLIIKIIIKKREADAFASASLFGDPDGNRSFRIAQLFGARNALWSSRAGRPCTQYDDFCSVL